MDTNEKWIEIQNELGMDFFFSCECDRGTDEEDEDICQKVTMTERGVLAA